MTSTEFWQVIEQGKASVQKTIETPAWLEAHLKDQPQSYIAAFEEQLHERFCESYDARLWAAAILMMGICGDDKFGDFRGWLVAQGRHVFDAALENPDVLTALENIDGDSGEPVLFYLQYTPTRAYRAKIGNDIADLPVNYRLPVFLNEEKWREWEGDSSKLAEAFPKLSAKYRRRA